MILVGEYEVSMDAKGRFMLPSNFRKELTEQEASLKFVLCRGQENCVSLYTMEGWNAYMAKLTKLNTLSAKVREVIRGALEGYAEVEADGAGRILITKLLQEAVGLKKDLIFSGQIDRVEIWDKDTYRSYMDSRREEIGQLNEELFGNDPFSPFLNT